MTESATRPAVLAFGGNALLPDPRNPNAQEENARAFADGLKLLLPKDAGMAVVHGNGPQVGMIMLRIEATRDRIPPESLDVLVAETQGSMGYLLTRALRSSFLEREVAAGMSADEAERLLDLGEFPPGSMGPKVKASILYARATGKKALITDLDHLADALEGQEGTWVMP